MRKNHEKLLLLLEKNITLYRITSVRQDKTRTHWFPVIECLVTISDMNEKRSEKPCSQQRFQRRVKFHEPIVVFVGDYISFPAQKSLKISIRAFEDYKTLPPR